MYHTPSTIPACVRPEVVRGWNSLWRRLRKMSRSDRSIEFKVGTLLKIGDVNISMRWVNRREYVTDDGVTFQENPNTLNYGLPTVPCRLRSSVWVLRLSRHEREVEGSCAFGDSKPYTYMDKFQDAVDELIALSVMES